MASQVITGASAVSKVLRSARRLEDQAAAAEQAAEPTYDFLTNYSIKLIGCKAGLEVADAQGKAEYSAVIFRLCPTSSSCSSTSLSGCKKGHGDFVVGLNTFVDAYFEDQRDNMNWDDSFDGNKFKQCGRYDAEKVEGEEEQEQVQYFLGPGCTKDGTGVKLGLYEDEDCTTASSKTFASISNGGTLPFATGGLVSTYCTPCEFTNEAGDVGIR